MDHFRRKSEDLSYFFCFEPVAEHCERLALVGSGGLGREVNPVLRLLTFPGADSLLRIASAAPVRSLVLGLGTVFGRAGMQPAPAFELTPAQIFESHPHCGNQ